MDIEDMSVRRLLLGIYGIGLVLVVVLSLVSRLPDVLARFFDIFVGLYVALNLWWIAEDGEDIDSLSGRIYVLERKLAELEKGKESS